MPRLLTTPAARARRLRRRLVGDHGGPLLGRRALVTGASSGSFTSTRFGLVTTAMVATVPGGEDRRSLTAGQAADRSQPDSPAARGEA